jgi:hypothetical protein
LWIVAIFTLDFPYIREFESYAEAKMYYQKWEGENVLLAEVKEIKTQKIKR